MTCCRRQVEDNDEAPDCLLAWKLLASFHLFAAVVLLCFCFFPPLIYFALPIQMENQHINMINNKNSGRWPGANRREKPAKSVDCNSLIYKSCHWLISFTTVCTDGQGQYCSPTKKPPGHKACFVPMKCAPFPPR